MLLPMSTNNSDKPFWYPAFAGFCLLIIGLGLGRFAYAPVIPAMIHQHWVTLSQAGYIGTANFLGYAIGAFTAYQVSRRFKMSSIMRWLLVASFLSLLCCVFNFGFWWLAFWRFVIGITGAFITILTVSVLSEFIEKKRRSAATGVIFAGTGFAIFIISIMVGPLEKISTNAVWGGFAVFGLLATLVIWPLTGRMKLPKKEVTALDATAPSKKKLSRATFIALVLLGAMYVMLGPGSVPHLLFLASYMHEVLHASIGLSGSMFSLLGLGVAVGGVSAGLLSQWLKPYGALIVVNIVGFISVLFVLFFHVLWLAAFSGFLMGWFVLALVACTSLRVFDFVPASEHAKFFGRFTLAFALAQFLTSYAVSYALNVGGTYHTIFYVELVALIFAIVFAIFARVRAA